MDRGVELNGRIVDSGRLQCGWLPSKGHRAEGAAKLSQGGGGCVVLAGRRRLRSRRRVEAAAKSSQSGGGAVAGRRGLRSRRRVEAALVVVSAMSIRFAE